MASVGHKGHDKFTLNDKYQQYLTERGAANNRLFNPYNLFYDLNLLDRYWLRKTRRHIKRLLFRRGVS